MSGYHTAPSTPTIDINQGPFSKGTYTNNNQQTYDELLILDYLVKQQMYINQMQAIGASFLKTLNKISNEKYFKKIDYGRFTAK